MLTLDQICHVHVELTTKCNARCPQCPRNFFGMDYNSGYPVTELTFDNFRHIFTDQLLDQLREGRWSPELNDWVLPGIQFNGNLGDFAAARDAREICHFLAKQGINIDISTNGSLRNTNWWASLALPGVKIGFAIDGLEDTHSLYRIDTQWNRVISNAKAFIDAGGHAIWRFIRFDHNQHQESDCRALAKELGFAEFEIQGDQAGRVNGPVFDRQGGFQKWLSNDDQNRSLPDTDELIVNHHTWFDPDTLKDPADNKDIKIECLHKRMLTIYIAADGSVYPCCFMGFYPSTMLHPGNSQMIPLVQENNALVYDLEHCLDWFNAIEKTWKKTSISEGRLYHCVTSCGKCV